MSHNEQEKKYCNPWNASSLDRYVSLLTTQNNSVTVKRRKSTVTHAMPLPWQMCFFTDHPKQFSHSEEEKKYCNPWNASSLTEERCLHQQRDTAVAGKPSLRAVGPTLWHRLLGVGVHLHGEGEVIQVVEELTELAELIQSDALNTTECGIQ